MEEEKKDKQEDKLIKKTDYRDNDNNALEEIQKTNKEILKLTKKINKFVFWQKVFSVIKLLIIIIPLLLAWRFLDDFMSDPGAMLNNPWFSTYVNNLLEAIGKNIDPTQINIDTNSIPAEYQHLLNR
ncbi:MAG: hypothetical protein U9Q85_02160 [Patescibacteria group bacterium]|nr:hypothetical protein [Patescibacteria group bacterium]